MCERTDDVERQDQDLLRGEARDGWAVGGDEPSPGTAGRDELLTPGEVARLFGVDPKTVSRWADAGKLDALRTLGGHRRYRLGEVEALLEDAEPN